MSESLDWLFKQFPSYQVMGSKAFKPTLDNTWKILEFLGHPEKELKFIHVAGSNGKGSVSCMLASILKESGFKVGLFTSPHIVDFTERIRIDGVPIDQESVESFINNVRSHTFDFSPSFFEITFGMALDHFKKNNCDICVIETGLGGRLDATNVITPELSVITTISLEHTNMLGDTLEEIAAEKAGIIKPGANVVLGNISPSLLHIFGQRAHHNGDQLISSSETDIRDYEDLFPVAYQKENFRTTLTALNEFLTNVPSSEIIRKGIGNLHENSGYFGRLQIMGQHPLKIFDVSHNADGISATLKAVEAINEGELHIVYGTSADKDLKEIQRVLPENANYYFTEFSNPRSAEIQQLKGVFSTKNLKSASYYKSPEDALNKAMQNCMEKDTILVIGSFFLLSDFF